jgi:hypothetical protein
VGFSEGCIAQRRRKWPDFARRMEETLEDAEMALEYRLAMESGAWGGLDTKGKKGSGIPAFAGMTMKVRSSMRTLRCGS